MPDGLKRKVGPFPLWVWALLVGGAIGGAVLLRGGQTSDPTVNDATDGGFLDPTQGAFGSEGSGSGLTGGGVSPVANMGDFASFAAQLRDAGFWPSVATEGAPSPSLIALAPGARYYDPLTGETVDGPESIAANSATSAKPKSAASPLDRAMTAVQKGAVGPVNRRRLRAAGYTDKQIDYHAKRKTPLGQPGKVSPKTTAPAKGKNAVGTSAPTHPNQHVTAKAPDHSRPRGSVKQTINNYTDSKGRKGKLNIHANGDRVFVPA